MLSIACPWCGPRDEIEFTHGGEGGRARPQDAGALDDEAWAQFLFMRRNEKGVRRERWRHAHGCGRWLAVERDTVTHQVLSVGRYA
jgi:sarcosine oxidase subunit delta